MNEIKYQCKILKEGDYSDRLSTTRIRVYGGKCEPDTISTVIELDEAKAIQEFMNAQEGK